ncbi:hypothetical protein BC829DRAFT_357397, partial [Chytridium lagenaria]
AGERSTENPFRVFCLEADAQCQCGYKLEDCTSPRVWHRGVLYSDVAASSVVIEVARCPVCPGNERRFIGPDLSTIGIFNKNNASLFSHRMMDMMTELMTNTEFSFSVFIKLRETCYYEFALGKPHIHPPSVRIFTAAWFAYRKLQNLSRQSGVLDIQCPFCSEKGYELVACDGISIGYSIDQQTGNLRPPTHTNDLSPVNEEVR